MKFSADLSNDELGTLRAAIESHLTQIQTDSRRIHYAISNGVETLEANEFEIDLLNHEEGVCHSLLRKFK